MGLFFCFCFFKVVLEREEKPEGNRMAKQENREQRDLQAPVASEIEAMVGG